MKLLGISVLASGVGAVSAKKGEARQSRPSVTSKPSKPSIEQTPASMKRLYALPILLDY